MTNVLITGGRKEQLLRLTMMNISLYEHFFIDNPLESD